MAMRVPPRGVVVPALRTFENGRNPHAAADAQRRQPKACLTSGKLVEQFDRQHRAARADGVAQGDRASHWVQLLLGNAQLARGGYSYRGKCLVYLEHLDLVEG